MKKTLPFLAGLLLAIPAFSQMGVGSSGSFTILDGTEVSIDSLVLIPSGYGGVTPFELANTNIERTATPVPSSNTTYTSIERVYNISNPFPFTGDMGLIYQNTELGTNDQLLLQVAFADNTNQWTTTANSVVGGVTNYLYAPATNFTLAKVTATTAGALLPINFQQFTAQLKTQYVSLDWKVGNSQTINSFDVESSGNGSSWKKIGSVIAANGKSDYNYRDNDLDFTVRYYRIAGYEHNGEKTFSSVAQVRKQAADFNIEVITSGSGKLVKFSNITPDGIQLYDMNGRLLKQIKAAQKAYQIDGIPTGIYILRFGTGTEQYAKRIVL